MTLTRSAGEKPAIDANEDEPDGKYGAVDPTVIIVQCFDAEDGI